MGYVLVAAMAFLFGAADQYVGGLWSATHIGFWTIDVSMMSAPWLALPFLVGARAPAASRAAWIGALATFAALLGYFTMTLSPIEGVALRQIHPLPFLVSQLHVILPAVVTGPLWGWLGHRWRTRRSWVSAVSVAVPFCLEPLARSIYGQPFAAAHAATAEAMTGILVMGLLLLVAVGRRSGARPTV
jgi:cytochrome b561